MLVPPCFPRLSFTPDSSPHSERCRGLQSVCNGSSLPLHLPHASPCSGVDSFHGAARDISLGPQITSSSSNLGLPSASPCLYFPPFLKQAFPEAPPSWLKGSAVSCSGSVGTSWNWLCPAQGSPGLSSQRPPCSPPAANFLPCKTNTLVQTERREKLN